MAVITAACPVLNEYGKKFLIIVKRTDMIQVNQGRLIVLHAPGH